MRQSGPEPGHKRGHNEQPLLARTCPRPQPAGRAGERTAYLEWRAGVAVRALIPRRAPTEGVPHAAATLLGKTAHAGCQEFPARERSASAGAARLRASLKLYLPYTQMVQQAGG